MMDLTQADVAWEVLADDLKAVMSSRVAKISPLSPAEYWQMMRPKDRTDWIYHERNGDPVDTWAEDDAFVSDAADPATIRAFQDLGPVIRDSYGQHGSSVGEASERSLRLTPASSIKPRPVRWLWDLRVALGTLCLLAGREGIGKSSIAYTLAAWITTGKMAGVYIGTPRAVIVAATEDSWAHTIVPRLMAAGANLDLVFRVDVTMFGDFDTEITLPSDLGQLEDAVSEVGAALILLDPIVSRLSANLDSHKDAEVRQALEPLTALADRTGAAVLGIIHVNKSGGGDALNMIMGSRAFGAVARSVLFAMKSPDDESIKFLGQPKNNLGRDDLPTMTYRIVGEHVADTEEGEVWTGRVDWLGESTQTIADALIASGDDPDARTATRDAVDWLHDYLSSVGGGATSADIKAAGKAVGHSERTLARARQKLHITTESQGFPRVTFWILPTEVADAR